VARAMTDLPSSGRPSAGRGTAERRAVEPRAMVAVIVRPRLWGAASRLAWRVAPTGWWRHWPPRPTPPAAYVAFRTHTVFGGASDESLSAAEVVAYLEWCRRMERARAHS
jgi:hypothetical protein